MEVTPLRIHVTHVRSVSVICTCPVNELVVMVVPLAGVLPVKMSIGAAFVEIIKFHPELRHQAFPTLSIAYTRR